MAIVEARYLVNFPAVEVATSICCRPVQRVLKDYSCDRSETSCWSVSPARPRGRVPCLDSGNGEGLSASSRGPDARETWGAPTA